MVRQLVIEANTLVQQAPHLQVRLDKDIDKLKVSPLCFLTQHQLPVQCANVIATTIDVFTRVVIRQLDDGSQFLLHPRGVHVCLEQYAVTMVLHGTACTFCL